MFKKSKLIYISLLLPTAVFLNAYRSLPSEIHLAKNSRYVLKTHPLCSLSPNTQSVCEVSGALISEDEDGILLNTENTGNYKLNVKMFNFLPVKTLDVTVSPEYSVIPSGIPVGIKIYADGLLVINLSDVTADDGSVLSPAKNSGLRVGDRIISADGKKLSFSEDFSKILNSSEKAVTLEVMRDDVFLEIEVLPVPSSNGGKKIGIWVRDSTAGVGTLTFFDPKTSSFAALGHAITDTDTGDVILPKSGSISGCKIAGCKKSTGGSPGELSGIFENNTLGTILLNSQNGIYGKTENTAVPVNTEYMTVGTRFQTKTGPAYIMSDIDGSGVKKYSIEIEDISKDSSPGNKGLVLRVTDPSLIEKTGGIVQGMSGSPIIQNGMLVGAVTHVFVNDPTRGYGIFAESMLDEALKIN